VDFDLPTVIQDCVDYFWEATDPEFVRVAVHINSGYRCIKYNNDITDGEGSGIHTTGMAADIWLERVYTNGARNRIPESEVADYFEMIFPDSHGIGRYPRDDETSERTHIDVRPDKARWTA